MFSAIASSFSSYGGKRSSQGRLHRRYPEYAGLPGARYHDTNIVVATRHRHTDVGIARGRVGNFSIGAYCAERELDRSDNLRPFERSREEALEKFVGPQRCKRCRSLV
jgi:hypothetical protein